MNTFGHAMIALTGLLAAAGGAWAISLELAPLTSGDDSVARVAHWTMSAPHIPLSGAAQDLILRDCQAVLDYPNQLNIRYLDPSVRQQLPQACGALAAEVIAVSPASGYAWYIAAMSSAAAGDMASMNQAITESQRVSPAEGWTAQQRLIFADQHFDSLDADSRQAYSKDMELLVQTGGVFAMAHRYAVHAPFRERVTRIIETLPAAQQRRFLAAVTTIVETPR